MPAHLVPTLVTFADVADPKSAHVVYATGPVMSTGRQPLVLRETILVDDFAAAFGPGYRFLRATVEIVPTGIWPPTPSASRASRSRGRSNKSYPGGTVLGGRLP